MNDLKDSRLTYETVGSLFEFPGISPNVEFRKYWAEMDKIHGRTLPRPRQPGYLGRGRVPAAPQPSNVPVLAKADKVSQRTAADTSGKNNSSNVPVPAQADEVSQRTAADTSGKNNSSNVSCGIKIKKEDDQNKPFDVSGMSKIKKEIGGRQQILRRIAAPKIKTEIGGQQQILRGNAAPEAKIEIGGQQQILRGNAAPDAKTKISGQQHIRSGNAAPQPQVSTRYSSSTQSKQNQVPVAVPAVRSFGLTSGHRPPTLTAATPPTPQSRLKNMQLDLKHQLHHLATYQESQDREADHL
jgi:hypothetical protein